jgi:hypothetical protein
VHARSTVREPPGGAAPAFVGSLRFLPTAGTHTPARLEGDAPEEPLVVEHAADIRACYAEELRTRPDFRIDETLVLTVAEDGRVEKASISLPDAPRARACLESMASSWRLPPSLPQLPGMPPPPSGAGTLAVRLHLAPDSRANTR